MAEESGLEKAAKTAAPTNEKKPPSRRESVVKEFSDLGRLAGNLAISATALFPSYYLGYETSWLAGSYILSGMARKNKEGKPFIDADLRDSSLKSLVAIPTWYAIKKILDMSKADGLDTLSSAFAAGAGTLGALISLNALYQPFKYVIDNKTFKGIFDDFVKNYWKDTKDYMIKAGLPIAVLTALASAISAFSPLYLAMAIAGVNFLYRTKSWNPLNYIPYKSYLIKGTLNTMETVGGLVNKGYQSLYKFGEWLRGTPKKQAQAPAPA